MNKYCLNCCDWINKDREDNPLELCDNCLDNKEYDWCRALFLCITIVVFLISSIKPTLSCGLFLFFYVITTMEAIMISIKTAIEGYLNSWIECEYCNEMCKLEHITSDCSDNPICKDCVEEEYRAHFH